MRRVKEMRKMRRDKMRRKNSEAIKKEEEMRQEETTRGLSRNSPNTKKKKSKDSEKDNIGGRDLSYRTDWTMFHVTLQLCPSAWKGPRGMAAV